METPHPPVNNGTKYCYLQSYSFKEVVNNAFYLTKLHIIRTHRYIEYQNTWKLEILHSYCKKILKVYVQNT